MKKILLSLIFLLCSAPAFAETTKIPNSEFSSELWKVYATQTEHNSVYCMADAKYNSSDTSLSFKLGGNKFVGDTEFNLIITKNKWPLKLNQVYGMRVILGSGWVGVYSALVLDEHRVMIHLPHNTNFISALGASQYITIENEKWVWKIPFLDAHGVMQHLTQCNNTYR